MTDPLVNLLAGHAEMPSTTSVTLLDRVKRGEAIAWERMVALYYPLVCHWCARKGLQPHDCVDVAQEVFVAVAKNIGSFRKESKDDSFTAWLRVIARSKLNDFWRRREKHTMSIGGSEGRRQLSEVPGETADETDEKAEMDDEAIVVRAALDVLRPEFEPQTWKAFWKVTVEGQPASCVAEEFGTSCNAIYLAKSRVLRRLREELEEWAIEGLD